MHIIFTREAAGGGPAWCNDWYLTPSKNNAKKSLVICSNILYHFTGPSEKIPRKAPPLVKPIIHCLHPPTLTPTAIRLSRAGASPSLTLLTSRASRTLKGPSPAGGSSPAARSRCEWGVGGRGSTGARRLHSQIPPPLELPAAAPIGSCSALRTLVTRMASLLTAMAASVVGPSEP